MIMHNDDKCGCSRGLSSRRPGEGGSIQPRDYSIPIVDLGHDAHRHVVVDREPGQYLGHPTTVLLEDGKTMIAVYPKGHGKGAIVMKRSADGGLTWSERLAVPENWATSLEVPTIYRVVDPDGVKRLIMFSGLYPIRMAVSEDDGETWTPLGPIGDFGGVVAMADLMRLRDGSYMAVFHDDGRFIRGEGKKTPHFKVYKTISRDGGLTWTEPEVMVEHPVAHLCEPGLVRSPDGKRIAMLLRENSRQFNSFVCFSDDEGQTWSEPREVPGALTGDRHQAVYAPDGRLFISFRDTTHESPTKGDWVGWVGVYDDIVHGREGQYRVRLMENHKGADCSYPALERLPDGTIVATTYGHWIDGEAPFIASVRFKLEDLDRKLAAGPKHFDVFVSGTEGYHTFRIPAVVVTPKGAVLAFCEGRASRSDHAQNDIVLKRSTDGGRTWGALQLIAEDGKNSLNNPTAVVVRDTGRVLLMYQSYPEGYHSDKVVPGYDPNAKICRTFLTFSDDDGTTWSALRDVTRMVKPETNVTATPVGPGVGIELRRGRHKGRILMPFVHRIGKPYDLCAVYSDDGGETWTWGEYAPRPTGATPTEVQFVELADGLVMVNARSHGGEKVRQVAISSDGGQTWSPLQDEPALIGPICQGTILRYTDPIDGRKSRILFGNPGSKTARVNGTVRLSYDEGKTWPVAQTVYFGSFAYSCLTVLADGAIGLLYERDDYAKITFARFPLEWLTDGRDSLGAG